MAPSAQAVSTAIPRDEARMWVQTTLACRGYNSLRGKDVRGGVGVKIIPLC